MYYAVLSYNAITKTSSWPAAWKVEHLTVIPKCKTPESESDCRNISCTNFLSRVYETFVLKWSQETVQPKYNQYGGQKGCSTYHFLAETFDSITEHLEDTRAASVLTSIDYSKAFNRVEHLPLLKSFVNKGAPTQIVRLLASFLSGRQMTVRMVNSNSQLRYVNAGATQGSVLGTYVFNVATDDLEDGIANEDIINEEELELSYLETQPETKEAESTPNKNTPNFDPDCSPVQEREQTIVISPLARNVPQKLKQRIEPSWKRWGLLVRKFVDDNLQVKKINMSIQRTFCDNNITFKNLRMYRSEQLFKHIEKNAKTK